METSLEGEVLTHSVDPEKMKTVLLNLIINAVESMPSGGRLHIATSRQESDGPGGNINQRHRLCGIELENIERIFDLVFFHQGKRQSGLGLALVNDIIRDHGGRIEVEQQPGNRQRVQNNYCHSSVENIQWAEAVRMEINKSSIRVLVVEDEISQRTVIGDILTDQGYGVDLAENGEKALELLEHGAYQAVVTDLKMPGVDGLQVLERAICRRMRTR